jgi:hypothetical protein
MVKQIIGRTIANTYNMGSMFIKAKLFSGFKIKRLKTIKPPKRNRLSTVSKKEEWIPGNSMKLIPITIAISKNQFNSNCKEKSTKIKPVIKDPKIKSRYGDLQAYIQLNEPVKKANIKNSQFESMNPISEKKTDIV